MEFEDVSERVEWEGRRVEEIEWQAQRVAMAFNAENLQFHFNDFRCYKGQGSQVQITWNIDPRTNALCYIDVGNDGCRFVYYRRQWCILPKAEFDSIMARGLYQLGFEDEGVLRELNHPLSAHEKLELRLDLPREFWPQKWRNEEAR